MKTKGSSTSDDVRYVVATLGGGNREEEVRKGTERRRLEWRQGKVGKGNARSGKATSFCRTSSPGDDEDDGDDRPSTCRLKCRSSRPATLTATQLYLASSDCSDRDNSNCRPDMRTVRRPSASFSTPPASF